MIKLAEGFLAKYDRWLLNAEVPCGEHSAYRKWLRFYLDYCSKYEHEKYTASESLEPFLAKLRSKRQSDSACSHAGSAVELCWRMARTSSDEVVGIQEPPVPYRPPAFRSTAEPTPRPAPKPSARAPGHVEYSGTSADGGGRCVVAN